VLEHTPDWVRRKYEQAQKEKWEESRSRITEGVTSLMLLVDGLFNKGKGSEEILPSSYEKAMEAQQEQIVQKEENFVKGSWWKKSG